MFRTLLGNVITLSTLLTLSNCGKNPDIEQIPTYSLCILDSIGTSDISNEDYLFGDIRDICLVDSEIYVLDRAQACIKVYNLNGEYQRQLSQYGNGPGELIDPVFMTITEDNSIIIIDGGSGVSKFTTTGEYQGNPLGEYTNPPIFIDGYEGNSFIGLHCDFSFNDNGFLQADVRVGLFKDSIDPDILYFQETSTVRPEDIGNFIYDLYNCVVYKSIDYNQICVGMLSDSEYKVVFMNGNADTIVTYLDNIDPVLKTPSEITCERDYYEYIFNFDHGPISINENHFAFSNIVGYDSQMHVWIYTKASSEAFSVFDTQANLLYKVTLPIELLTEANTEYWRFSVQDDVIFAWSETETDFQQIYILSLDCDQHGYI